jgi:hypothetical protein
MVSCPVIVVVMLESRVVRCVHCDEDVASNISSTEVKERVELYIYSISRPSWPLLG